MCITEYNEVEALLASRKEERNHLIYELVQDGDLSIEKGAQKLNISVISLEKLMRDNGYKVPASAM